jgi:cytochrome P450
MSMLLRALTWRYPGLASIPGPAPVFPLGNLQDFAHGRPWETTLADARRYGPVTRFWMFDRPAVFVHEPEAIDQILNTKRELFVKNEPTAAMRPGSTSSSIFVSTGADWAAKRRSDFFADKCVSGWLEERFAPSQEYQRRRWASLLPIKGEPRFERQLYRFVFDLMSFLIFGRRLGDRVFQRYNHIMDVVDARMKTNLPLLSPQFHRTRRRWHKTIQEQLEANEEDPDGRSLSHLLARQSRLPREQLVAELANIYPGGVFSITVAVAHALSSLCADGRTMARVRAELSALRERPSLPYAELCSCAALEGVVRESLRLYAPAPVFMRMVKAEEARVGPLRLPKGVRVIIGILPLHRDADHWPCADEFIPSRWTAETRAQNPYGSAYFFPFGRGPRTCGGQEFALYLIRSVLFNLLSDPERTIEVGEPEGDRFYFGCMMPTRMRATMS